MPQPQVYLIISQKGGVGKTTLAVNLAAVVFDTLGGDPAQPPVLVASPAPTVSTTSMRWPGAWMTEPSA